MFWTSAAARSALLPWQTLPRFVFEAAKRLLPGLLDTSSPIEHSIRSPAEQARRIFHQHLLLLILILQPAT